MALAAAAAMLLCAGCAKDPTTGKNDANKRYLDAWMTINHPDASRVEPGIYVIGDQPGSGSVIGSEEDAPYIYVDYTVRQLNGDITSTSDARTAQQLGTYKAGNYYGPMVLTRGEGYFPAGLEAMINTMRKGGTRSAVIPGWLTTVLRRKTEAEYMKEFTGTDAIYTVTLVDEIRDMAKWQIDSIQSYISRHFAPADSLKYGFYMIQTQAPSDDTELEKTAKIKVNYTGMLLNGTIFDTTDEKLAKDNGVFSSSRTYGPMTATLAEDYKEIELGSSTVVDGFSYCLSKMKVGQKVSCFFISDLGYNSQSTSSIPGYSPLRFDIEIVGVEQ